jgi:hypothetical protein
MSKISDKTMTLYPHYNPLKLKYFYLFLFYSDTGHLLESSTNNTIIVKEGSEAVLPCKAIDSSTTVKLYKENYRGFELVSINLLPTDT